MIILTGTNVNNAIIKLQNLLTGKFIMELYRVIINVPVQAGTQSVIFAKQKGALQIKIIAKTLLAQSL